MDQENSSQEGAEQNTPESSEMPPVPPMPPKMEQSGDSSADDITGVDSNKLMAALSYLGILVIIPLLVSRKDKYVLFHAKQGLVLLIGYVLSMFVVSWLPLIGNLFWLAIFVGSIAGLVQSLRGKWWKMPVVGDLATKFKI